MPNLQRYLLRLVCCASLLLACGAGLAAEGVIGYVKTVSGVASVTTRGQRIAARPGTPLYQGSRLATGAQSSLGVSFVDDTLMSFGPDTELTVDEYVYAPGQGQLRLASSMLRGSLNYVSGVIARLRPDAVSVKTPGGTLGVRGTQFVLTLDGAAP